MPGTSRTRSLVCEWKKHTSKSPQVSRFAGIPCAMVYDLFRVLPGETGLCCHRRLSEDSKSLAPASGRRDHTASPSAKECRSSCDTSASTASRLAFVTTRPPLILSRDGGGKP